MKLLSHLGTFDAIEPANRSGYFYSAYAHTVLLLW